ncbi:aldolase [Bacillus sp. JJ1609]|uniref:aldolase n=1 Tax=Bacillus sp. JJ1609 TaxID=3122977 RepID=UPI002FFF577B
MVITETSYVYNAFGLKIKSNIELPELSLINKPIESPDIFIEVTELEEYWVRNVRKQQGMVIFENNNVAFHIKATATFLIKDGKKIIASLMQGCDKNKIRLYLLGTCMGVILMQRKVLALHGSAIAVNGKAYAFVGDSGAGKSTLASAFMNSGYKLLSDDLIPVAIINEIPYIIPSYPQQKLWGKSLQLLKIDSSKYSPLFDREDKFAIPVHSNYCDQSLELAGIFVIEKNDRSFINIETIQNLERFRSLFNQTFRSFLISRFQLMDWHFYESSRIINKTKMYRVQRPSVGFTAPELVERILEIIKKEMI